MSQRVSKVVILHSYHRIHKEKVMPPTGIKEFVAQAVEDSRQLNFANWACFSKAVGQSKAILI